MPDNKKRIIASAAFVLLLAVEIIIGMYAHGFIRDYVGDVLVIPLIYSFIRIFYVRESKLLPLLTGCLGIVAEVLQYFDLCGILGIEKGSLLNILLGSSADFKDIICYAAGTLLIYAAEFSGRRIFQKK